MITTITPDQRFTKAQEAWQAAEREVAYAALAVIVDVADATPGPIEQLIVEETDQDMSGSPVFIAARSGGQTLDSSTPDLGPSIDELSDAIHEALSWLDSRNRPTWKAALVDPDVAPMTIDIAKARAIVAEHPAAS